MARRDVAACEAGIVYVKKAPWNDLRPLGLILLSRIERRDLPVRPPLQDRAQESLPPPVASSRL